MKRQAALVEETGKCRALTMTEPHFESSCQCERCRITRSYCNGLLEVTAPNTEFDGAIARAARITRLEIELAETRQRLAVAIRALRNADLLLWNGQDSSALTEISSALREIRRKKSTR